MAGGEGEGLDDRECQGRSLVLKSRRRTLSQPREGKQQVRKINKKKVRGRMESRNKNRMDHCHFYSGYRLVYKVKRQRLIKIPSESSHSFVSECFDLEAFLRITVSFYRGRGALHLYKALHISSIRTFCRLAWSKSRLSDGDQAYTNLVW